MKAGEAKLKYLGRTMTDADGTIWCALSGSGVEFRYRGTSLTVVMAGDDLTRLPKQQYEQVKTTGDHSAYPEIVRGAAFHCWNPGI